MNKPNHSKGWIMDYTTEKYLYYGRCKSKVFKKNIDTKLLLDANLLWVSGFMMKHKNLSYKLVDLRMKYKDIDAIEIIDISGVPLIKITGRSYRARQAQTLYLPNVEDMDQAVTQIRDLMITAKESQVRRISKLKSLRQSRVQSI